MRVFGYFLHEQKVPRGGAGEPHEIVSRIAAIRGKKCCLPSRPAMGESKRIGALRRHRRIKNGAWGRSPRKAVWS